MSEHRHKMPNAEKLATLPILGNLPKDDREEDFLREICEYEFFNLEEPGTPLTFPYGSTINQHTFTFLHGGKYRVPRCVARHVEGCQTPIWDWRPDGEGRIQKKQTGTNPRFRMSLQYS